MANYYSTANFMDVGSMGLCELYKHTHLYTHIHISLYITHTHLYIYVYLKNLCVQYVGVGRREQC